MDFAVGFLDGWRGVSSSRCRSSFWCVIPVFEQSGQQIFMIDSFCSHG
jgi:hypothetical protein